MYDNINHSCFGILDVHIYNYVVLLWFYVLRIVYVEILGLLLALFFVFLYNILILLFVFAAYILCLVICFALFLFYHMSFLSLAIFVMMVNFMFKNRLYVFWNFRSKFLPSLSKLLLSAVRFDLNAHLGLWYSMTVVD